MEDHFDIITNFILVKILINVKNVGSTLLVIDTLKHIKEFTLVRKNLTSVKNLVGSSLVENESLFDI